MNIATIAGHLAFGLIAFSFLVKDIMWLRFVSILASSFSVFYNWVIPVEPMWLAINWNFVFIPNKLCAPVMRDPDKGKLTLPNSIFFGGFLN